MRGADGDEFTEEIIAPKGEVENPMTPSDVEEKFHGLAAPVVGAARARAVIDEVKGLDTRESLAPLLGALTTIL